MTITDDIVKTLRNPTPLYAVAGTADLAAEKLREVPGLIEKIRERAPERFEQIRERAPERIEKLRATDPRAVQERVTAQAKDAQAKLNERIGELDLKKLGESVQGLALQGVGRAAEYAVKARETYDDLAVRGKGAVATWRGDGADHVMEIPSVVEVKTEKTEKADAADDSWAEEESAAPKKPGARRSTPKKSAE